MYFLHAYMRIWTRDSFEVIRDVRSRINNTKKLRHSTRHKNGERIKYTIWYCVLIDSNILEVSKITGRCFEIKNQIIFRSTW